jgi:hypothetical protein
VDQAELLRYTVLVLERVGIPYAIVGSFASGIWGEPRFTQDIDILIQLSLDQVKLLCSEFPASDFYVSESAARNAVARRSQFNVIHPASGNKIDFMIAGSGNWPRQQLARRKQLQVFADHAASVAAPEDVIIGKLICYHEAGSDKHLRDIAGILQLSSNLIDRDYVARFAAEFDVIEVWQAVISRVDAS